MTPFPTGFSQLPGQQSFHGRGAKSQYLIPATEMAAFGCGPVALHGFSLEVLDDEFNMFPNGPLNHASIMIVEVRMRQTTLADLNMLDTVVNTSGTLLSRFRTFHASYDQVTGMSNYLYLLAGELKIAFSAPFAWDGTSDLILDISYIRGPTIGLSPRVLLDTGLAYQATAYGHTTMPLPGGAFTSTYPPNTHSIRGSNNTRPVIKWYTVPITPTFPNDLISTGIERDPQQNIQEAVYPNPVDQQLTLPTSEDDQIVQLVDATGAVVKEQVITNHGIRLQMSVTELPVGVYLARVLDHSGRVLRNHSFVVQR